MSELGDLQQRLRDFARERDWQQFHTPNNLIMALTAECGELAGMFRWLDDEQAIKLMRDPAKSQEVEAELADVLGCLLRLADVLGVDLVAALECKIGVNACRYPVDEFRGQARKYNEA
jgi:NTP pyrophosphatase (non-canonical NTP hydrolase)